LLFFLFKSRKNKRPRLNLPCIFSGFPNSPLFGPKLQQVSVVRRRTSTDQSLFFPDFIPDTFIEIPTTPARWLTRLRNSLVLDFVADLFPNMLASFFQFFTSAFFEIPFNLFRERLND